MRKINELQIGFWALLLMIGLTSYSQEQSLGSMVTKKVGVYVFPANNQTASQQSTDETACYQWAVQQSGVDPLNPPKVEAAQVETGPDGSAVKGAAVGAAGGAAIGAIAGDAGEGAAIGAIVGGIRGRRASKQAKAQQQQANNQAAAAYSADMINNFKKAYSACLEGKGYTVK